jgi:RNA polymerase sigma factor (sigma-70 family)
MPTRLIHHLRRAALVHEAGGLSDGQLLKCFVTIRDEAAFEALVRRHGPMVLGVCRRVLGNLPDAEDAFQAVFLVLVRKAASLHAPELLANWLYGVAYRTALKAREALVRQWTHEKQVKDMPHPQAEPETVRKELQLLLDQELRRLPEKYRVPVILCELEGRSRKEAARQLGIPEGTLSSRLAMARRIVAKRLTGHGGMLSGIALAAALAGNGASACLPIRLADSTIKAALLVAAGNAAAASKASALSEGVLKAMLLTKLKTGAAVFLVVIIVGLGTAKVVQEAGVAQAGLVESVPAAQDADDEAKLPGTALRWSPLGRPLYLLVMNSAVQAELKLNGGQKKALAAFQSEIVKPLRSWRELDWDERDRRYAAAKDQTKIGLRRILDARQLQRLSEIDLQQRGCRGITSDAEIAAKLKLTAKRCRELARSMEVADHKSAMLGCRLIDVNDVYKNYKQEMAEERRRLIQELVKLHSDGYEHLQAALTEEQRKLFRGMLGKQFDTAALLEAID